MSSGGTVRIMADRGLVRWQKGFRGVAEKSRHLPHGVVHKWQTAVEVMFGATQQMIHVVSGDLQGSGRMDIVEETGETVTAAITYGGGRRSNAKPTWKHQEIDYAKYELERGGSHDFFTRAEKKSRKRLQEGVGEGLVELMKSEDW
ncbi:hypothetical protein SEA_DANIELLEIGNACE_19 [Arthrobacter phage DanielleIgnace]|nr:hypothetical protein SEA_DANIELLEIGNACE_19 [Arthrobacter phage DanielleIgnace]